MITRDQATLMASEKAWQDFPGYEVGSVMHVVYEDQCWYVRIRLYQRQDRQSIDVLYGVYFSASNKSWIAMLFDDHLRDPRPIQRARLLHREVYPELHQRCRREERDGWMPK